MQYKNCPQMSNFAQKEPSLIKQWKIKSAEMIRAGAEVEKSTRSVIMILIR